MSNASKLGGSEGRARRLADAASEAILLHDGNVIVEVNRAITDVFGYEVAEALGMSVIALFAEESRGVVEERLKSSDRQTFEATAVRKDGSTFPVEATSTHVSSEGGELRGLAMANITAHKKSEEALRQSEELFRIISSLSSEGLVLTERGVIFHANTAMCQMLGYTHEELMQVSPLQLTTPEYREIARHHIMNNDETPYETVALRKDGTMFPARVVGRLVPFQGRAVRGTAIRDLTPQKQAEEALRLNVQQQEQIRAQALRLAELSTPVIPISDDILVLPLIGSMDSARAQRVMETMLQGVVRSRAHTAIIDVTGVTGIDAQVADALVSVARAVRLLGADVILTGIRPDAAQVLALLGADLSTIISKGTLQSGIAYAMNRRRE